MLNDFSIELAQALVESGDQFPVDLNDAWQWCGYTDKRRAKEILEGYMVDGEDFSSFGQKDTLGRPSEDIRLSVDGFKQLAMLARSEQGTEVRKYFIECERIAKEKQSKPVSQFDVLKQMMALHEEQQSKLAQLSAAQVEQERRIESIEAEQERYAYPSGRYYSAMGYGNLLGIKLTLSIAANVGIKATKICKALDICIEKVSDPRFRKVNTYPEDVLSEIFAELNLTT